MYRLVILLPLLFTFFFFNDTATTEIYTLSLHDALPILLAGVAVFTVPVIFELNERPDDALEVTVWGQKYWWGYEYGEDRKSTRLNSSHVEISYAVFCLKKKKKENKNQSRAI